jgi:hypothetical protein
MKKMMTMKLCLCGVLLLLITRVSPAQVQPADTIRPGYKQMDCFSYCLVIRDGYSQQIIKAGDHVKLKLLYGRMRKHIVSAICNNSFEIDYDSVIYPEQVLRIAKIKRRLINYIAGSVITLAGIGVLAAAKNDNERGENIILASASTALITAGTSLLSVPQTTYNLKKGAHLVIMKKDAFK